MNKLISILMLPVVAWGLVALDIWLKIWAENNLMGEPGRVIVPGLLGLIYFENSGVAFGLFADAAWGQWVFAGLKFLLLVGLVWYYYTRLPRVDRSWWLRVPIILIVAGGAGNLIDRISLGRVRDMLRFEFSFFPYIFNLADVYVVVGCIMLAFVTLFVVKEM
ncbi:MAG: signal peptidase II [Defluviitaleaceae bacterium]|nr:signal peptidase II [Defluviitaleaceae bacterium]